MQKNPLPATGFLRLSQIIGDKKANPPVPPIIPVSKSTWWAWVRAKRLPQPVKLGERITAWRVDDLRDYLERAAEGRET